MTEYDPKAEAVRLVRVRNSDLESAIETALREAHRAGWEAARDAAANAIGLRPGDDSAPGCCAECAAKWWQAREIDRDIRALQAPEST